VLHSEVLIQSAAQSVALMTRSPKDVAPSACVSSVLRRSRPRHGVGWRHAGGVATARAASGDPMSDTWVVHNDPRIVEGHVGNELSVEALEANDPRPPRLA
jgi:hypothetical protein